MSNTEIHLPVLPQEVLTHLASEEGHVIMDATAGYGGHADLLLGQIGPTGKYMAVDQDPNAIRHLTQKYEKDERVSIVNSNFTDAFAALRERGVTQVNRILADLGVSSYQFDTAERGFSFRFDGPLDMRMDNTQGPTAADIVNSTEESKLADIFYHYGEERRSRPIAKAICQERKIQRFTTTTALAEFVAKLTRGGKSGIHPATRVFQALRIAVNRELDVLQSLMDQALTFLSPGGRLGIISFHSLEDRMVKQTFREAARGDDFRVLTKKPVIATEEEVHENPRSRSAKLRVIEYTGGDHVT